MSVRQRLRYEKPEATFQRYFASALSRIADHPKSLLDKSKRTSRKHEAIARAQLTGNLARPLEAPQPLVVNI